MHDFTSASRYLLPSSSAFWRWGEAGDVAEWKFGGTIAFREQIAGLLTSFAESRLPPFELILLVLAACRDTWPDDRARLEKQGQPPWWRLRRETLLSLEYVHRLPRQMRTSFAAVLAIMDTVFERHPLDAQDSAAVVALLRQPEWLADLRESEPPDVSPDERDGYLGWFRRRVVRLTVDALLNRMSTGLDQLPDPAESAGPEEDDSDRSVCRLLEELCDEEQHRGLVRLVRMVSAVLTLPRTPSEPDDLPQGGVSDIASRGNPDQLLLSELAHDDETLITRIALNEALYIRRETPPADPVQERTILIDGGIRMWGLPRLFATAVGLALAQEHHGESVQVFRSDRGGLTVVDFTTRAGLTDHLAALDHRAHPGTDFESWERQFSGDLVQRVLITEDSVLADPGFRQQFTDREVAPFFIILVNRSGRVRLTRRTPAGEKLLRELWLDPDELSGAASTDSDSLQDPSIDPALPAIIHLRHLPLRLPYDASDIDALIRFPRSSSEKPDVLQVTRDRRLLLWDTPQAGGRQLTDRLPRGRVRWSGQLADDGSISIVTGGQQSLKLHHIRVTRDPLRVDVFPLHLQQPASQSNHIFEVAGHLGVLFVVFRTSIAAVDPISGEQLDSILIPTSYQPRGDRYFRDLCRWYMISFSSGRLAFEFLADLPEPSAAVETLGIVGGDERPIAVRSNGEVYDIIGQETRQIAQASQWSHGTLLDVSRDGRRFVIARGFDESAVPRVRPTRHSFSQASVVQISGCSSSEMPQFVVNELSQGCDPRYLVFADAAEFSCLPCNRALFKKPAGLSYGRQLMIVTQKGRRLLLDMRRQHPRGVVLRDAVSDDRPFRETVFFDIIPGPKGVGYRLKQVQWSDGSRAVLDSRGMLHLQSSDPEVPEITLILQESNVSGWCSSGATFGLPFYTDENRSVRPLMDPGDVLELIQQFVQRLP